MDGASAEIVIRRTTTGWRVGAAGANVPEQRADEVQEGDLASAMVLADLLAADLEPHGRPPQPDPRADELTRLRASVAQLEHALAARVVVERAIGVLAERRHCTPREAFELMRRTSRMSGRRVHTLAAAVVASVTDPATELPPAFAS